jgi:hypothetical protein
MISPPVWLVVEGAQPDVARCSGAPEGDGVGHQVDDIDVLLELVEDVFQLV